ncbi:hypothetical protein GBAR_LOCUS839, partial [Geodia barretti]
TRAAGSSHRQSGSHATSNSLTTHPAAWTLFTQEALHLIQQFPQVIQQFLEALQLPWDSRGPPPGNTGRQPE